MPRLWLGLAVVVLAGAWRCAGTAPAGQAAVKEWDVRITSCDGTAKKQGEYSADADATALRELLWQALLAAKDAPRMVIDARRIKEIRSAAHVEVESRPALSGEIAKWKKPVTASHILLPLAAGWQQDTAYVLHGNPAYATGQVYVCAVDGAELRRLLEALKLPVAAALPLPSAEEEAPR